MLMPLQKHFDHLEKQKRSWLTQLKTMDDARLRYRNAPGEWSALEVLEHLVKTESGILDTTLKTMPNGPAVPIADKIKGRAVEWLFRSPARVKVPAKVSSVLPGPVESLAEVEERWTASRVLMYEGLSKVEDLQPGRGCFQHPVSGWMSLEQTLRFLSAHLVHHEYQLGRQEKVLRK